MHATHVRSGKTGAPARLRLQQPWVAVSLGVLAVFSALPGSAVDLTGLPLSVPVGIPGNLVLTPSVQWPTVMSPANRDAYTQAKAYSGYFDPDKCYQYNYHPDEPLRHFSPAAPSPGHGCARPLWSGNFLNWVGTQTIDSFRSAMTGGYRVVDTPAETWLEKAVAYRADEAGVRLLPRRSVPTAGDNAGLLQAAVPAGWPRATFRLDGLFARMYLTSSGNVADDAAAVPYDPADPIMLPADGSDAGAVYEVSLRVKVCDPAVGLEPNCVPYSQGFKPEGLIQQNANRLTYSVFSYLNPGENMQNDGGVMRARQKFVGPFLHKPLQAPVPNPAREWDPDTGVLIRNPDAADADATNAGIQDSGVINYLNKFYQLNPTRYTRWADEPSELLYAASRYLRNLGSVGEYSQMPADPTERYAYADGFPVIDRWDDPVPFRCAANAIVGIGDSNTQTDKNLPGPTSGFLEPPKAPAVVADTGVDVVRALRQIYLLEGLSVTDAERLSRANSFRANGSGNSAYIAAIAYDLHTRDFRPEGTPNALKDKQTAATFWVDVLEEGLYQKGTNQYWLTGKYGGFNVPQGFDPYADNPVPLAMSSWADDNDFLDNDPTFVRPRNFYTASDAGKMIEGLNHAFRSVVSQVQGSSSGLGANGPNLQAGSMVYQPSFNSGTWRGDLTAFALDPLTGTLDPTPVWSASDQYPAGDGWQQRKVFVNSGGYKPLDWAALTSAHRAAIGSAQVLDYLRGDRSGENDALRERKSVLGDIINSAPVHVGAPNPLLYRGKQFAGAAEYPAFAAANASRRPVVYVGANDGFLHGFDASASIQGGTETYAFMPEGAITPGLNAYARPGYAHQYSVDGEMTVADVYVNGAWRSVLVGTLGRGGAGVYALDVTDPANVRFLWELGPDDVPALGNSLGKPMIGQVSSGQWRVFIGSGPNAATNSGALVSVNLATGGAVATPTAAPGSVSPGVSGPALWDSDQDGFIDTAYAGDLEGALWRFEQLNRPSPRVTLLHRATGPSGVQPITAAPIVARKPGTQDTFVIFGTGQYLMPADLGDRSIQSWYGLIDRGHTIAGRAGLSPVTILQESGAARAISLNPAAGPDGWAMDLVSPGNNARGERMVLTGRFQGSALVGTTRIPDATDPCAPGGSGYLMAVDPFTGGRLPDSFFDMDGDGTVGNPGDLIDENGNPIPSSGHLIGTGPNMPVLIGDSVQLVGDDGTVISIGTGSGGKRVRRVSWREVLGVH